MLHKTPRKGGNTRSPWNGSHPNPQQPEMLQGAHRLAASHQGGNGKLFLKTLSMLTFPDHWLVLTFIYFNLSKMKVRLHKREIHLHKSTENLWRSISIPSRDEAMDFLEEHKAGRHCCNLARKLKHWAKAFSTHKIATKHFQFKNIFRKIRNKISPIVGWCDGPLSVWLQTHNSGGVINLSQFSQSIVVSPRSSPSPWCWNQANNRAEAQFPRDSPCSMSSAHLCLVYESIISDVGPIQRGRGFHPIWQEVRGPPKPDWGKKCNQCECTSLQTSHVRKHMKAHQWLGPANAYEIALHSLDLAEKSTNVSKQAEHIYII